VFNDFWNTIIVTLQILEQQACRSHMNNQREIILSDLLMNYEIKYFSISYYILVKYKDIGNFSNNHTIK